MPTPEEFDYPRLNATFNAISFCFLVAGFAFIRGDRKKQHIICMVSALVASAAFLTSYLIYHLQGPETKFPLDYPLARKIYLTILFTHIPLAMVLVPLVIMTMIPALRKHFDKHRRVARITFPIWIYVSVTGVIIYLMLYQWFPSPSSGKEGSPQHAPQAAAVTRAPEALMSHHERDSSPEEPTGEVPQKGEADRQPVEAGGQDDFPAVAALSFSPSRCEIEADPSAEVVTARFEVSNHTDRDIGIVKLDTSCDCLDVRSSNAAKIPAGQSVSVEADFTLQKLVGSSEKYVILRTDHPSHEEVRLAVAVAVDPIYSIEPVSLRWNVGDKPEPKEIVFRVLRDEPIRITGLQSTREKTFTSAMRAVQPGREYRIVLTPNSTDEEMLGYVRVSTDCEIEKYASELMYFRIARAGDD